jgi:hypothetical protein
MFVRKFLEKVHLEDEGYGMIKTMGVGLVLVVLIFWVLPPVCSFFFYGTAAHVERCPLY